MAKKFIVTLGYTKYAIEMEDAVALLAIAERCKKVEYGANYSKPFIESEEQERFVTSMELEEVVPFSPPMAEPATPAVPLAIAAPVKALAPPDSDCPF